MLERGAESECDPCKWAAKKRTGRAKEEESHFLCDARKANWLQWRAFARVQSNFELRRVNTTLDL